MRRHLLLPLALLLNAGNLPAQEEALGRLFLTPAERTALDRQRHIAPGANASRPDQESRLTINGEVRRSSGRNTRWINGEANWGPTPPAAAGVAVGDTIFPATGERENLLRDGRIIIKPGGGTR